MGRIVGIVLAAGKSLRMGRDKLSLPVGKKLLGSFVFESALQSALEKVIVVTAANDTPAWITSPFFEQPSREKWVHVKSEYSHLGQAHSLQCGIRAAQTYEPAAVMILLADQPFVGMDMINHLINYYCVSQTSYVAACFEGILRPPVIFSEGWFKELMGLKGDEGARKLLRRGLSKGISVAFENPLLFFDVDTMDQYQSLIKMAEKNK